MHVPLLFILKEVMKKVKELVWTMKVNLYGRKTSCH